MDSNPRHFFIDAIGIEANVDADTTKDYVTIEERLKQGDCYADHAAWEYNGKVWFDPDSDTWYEQIWRYGNLIGTITGDSATNVIAQALARYGVE
jgi:hypothetical protein